MTFVSLENVSVSYDGQTKILEDLNLYIQEGELVSLLGPSGCGKTTTLRVVAGLVEAQEGKLNVDGNNMINTPVHQRNFGMVFQSYALFPHMTVRENIVYGLKLRKVNESEIDEKVNRMVTVVGLEGLADRYPEDLSGGQRQRVALARALVIEPKLLLLDEPLSNLDAKLRVQLRNEIRRIQQELKITTLFVTHDQEECFSISDKVAVMNKGEIEQFDRPEVIYRKPKTEFVARFIGFENFLTLTKGSSRVYQTQSGFTVGQVESDKSSVLMTIRPDDIILETSASTNALKGTIELVTFLGKSYQYVVRTADGEIIVNDDRAVPLEISQAVYLQFPEESMIILED